MIFFNLHPSGLLVPNGARPTANDGETPYRFKLPASV